MPTVPQAFSGQPELRNLPGVASIQATPEDFGAGVGESLLTAGKTIAREGQRLEAFRDSVQQKADAESADRALTAYVSDMDATATTLRQRQAAEAFGSTTEWATAEKKWYTDEKGVFSTLTPRARELFQSHAARYSSRYRDSMANHEHAQTLVQRDLDKKGAYAANETAALNALGSEDFAPLVSEASPRYADTVVGSGVSLNPDGTRAFRSPADQQLWEASKTAKENDFYSAQANHFIGLAAKAPVDEAGNLTAQSLLAQAEEQAATLPPAQAQAIRTAALHATALRESRAKSEAFAAQQAIEQRNKEDAQAIEKIRLTSAAGKYADASSAAVAINAVATRNPAVAAEATRHIDYMNALLADRAQAAAADAKTAQTLEMASASTANRRDLEAGTLVETDPATGDPVLRPISYRERLVLADQLWTSGKNKGGFDDSDHSAALKKIQADQDKRIDNYRSAILRDILPAYTPVIAPADTETPFSLTGKPKTARLRAATAATDTGIDNTYTTIDPKKNKPVTTREHVLLGQALDLMNATKEYMADHPEITPEQGVNLFKAAATGTLRELDQTRIGKAIGSKVKLSGSLRETLSTMNRLNSDARASAALSSKKTP